MTDLRVDPEIQELLQEIPGHGTEPSSSVVANAEARTEQKGKRAKWAFWEKDKPAKVGADIKPPFLDLSEEVDCSGEKPEIEGGLSPAPKTKWGFRLKKFLPNTKSAAENLTDSVAQTKESKEGQNKGGLFSWLKREKAVIPTADRLPIKVIIGYLPEVTARDAADYAYGLAEKYFDQMGLAYGGVFKYERGMVYEIHEGGVGKAFAPTIIQYFESLPPFDPAEVHRVVIRTATRKVEVQRLRDGLAAVILPESSDAEPTEWLRQTAVMSPLIDTRKGFVRMATMLFGAGIFAMLASGIFFRLQPYEEAVPVQKKLRPSDYPSAQWEKVQNVPEDSYVKALKFANGR